MAPTNLDARRCHVGARARCRAEEVRELKGLSLAIVANAARMSPTYLQKLERGEVESPLAASPAQPRQRARCLLHELDGARRVHRARDEDPARQRGELLLQALSSQGLTDEEVRDVAEFVAFKRQQAARRDG